MHRREVGNIIEEAAEKDVVAEGVYWSSFFFFGMKERERRRQRGGYSRGDDKKNLTGNEDSQIMNMLWLNRDLSHGKPHGEEQTTPSQASCHFPRFVPSILVVRAGCLNDRGSI